MATLSDKSYFNFFTHALEDDRACLCLEIYAAGRLVDVEYYPGWMTRAACDLQATARNRLALRNGEHVSIYFMAQEAQAASAA